MLRASLLDHRARARARVGTGVSEQTDPLDPRLPARRRHRVHRAERRQHDVRFSGQPIVIENRPGAAAIVGAEAAARSAADGYTLFMADNGTFVFHTGIYKKLPYDPVKDFAPVGMIVKGYMLLLSTQFTTLKELVDAAKAQPGQAEQASNGSGTAHHLAMELLKQRAGIEVVNVPYKGTAAVMQEVLSGRVAMGFADLSAARGQISAGKVRVLAVAAKKRLEQLPDVPTFEELGLSGVRGLLLAGSRGARRHFPRDRQPLVRRSR